MDTSQITSSSSSWENLWHNKGTLGLLQTRQKQGIAQDVAIEKAARRALIRACILRGAAVPEGLIDGKHFGEDGADRQLDQLMVRVAAFRARLVWLIANAGGDPAVKTQEEYLTLMQIATDLDSDLHAWPFALSQHWQFQMFTCSSDSEIDNDEFLYGSNFHIYKTLHYASSWNRFRAIRLIVKSLYLRLHSLSLPVQSLTLFGSEEFTTHQNDISSIAIDMCQSIFYFLNNAIRKQYAPEIAHTRQDHSIPEIQNQVKPNDMWLLAWPLTIAVRTQICPSAQRRWLQGVLRKIAHALSDGVLQAVVDKGEFSF